MKAGDRRGRPSLSEVGRGARTARVRALTTAGLVKRAIGILAVLGIGVTLIGPWRDGVIDRVQDIAGEIRDVVSQRHETVSYTPSASSEHRPVTNIRDEASNTSWAEGERGRGRGASVTLMLDEPRKLTEIRIIPGASEVEADFLAQPRPMEIRLDFSNGAKQSIKLRDKPREVQEFALKLEGEVDSVKLTIVELHVSGITLPTCAITEVWLIGEAL
jgi:hypothetical protein